MKKSAIVDFRYDYRERIGWPELLGSVSKVYQSLSIDEQLRTKIITGNFREAGSINHYGRKRGLPKASSGISSYHSWGLLNPQASTVIYGQSSNIINFTFL